MEDEQHPIDLVASIIGSQVKLAAALGVTRAAVHQWKVRGIPAEYCPLIELLTKGKVRCEQLRPDVAWHVLRRKPRKPKATPAATA